jgi:hypothetical protein
MFSDLFPKNLTAYDMMSKNALEPEGTQITSQYGACVLQGG